MYIRICFFSVSEFDGRKLAKLKKGRSSTTEEDFSSEEGEEEEEEEEEEDSGEVCTTLNAAH